MLLREYGDTNPKDPENGWSISFSMAAGRKTLSKQAMIDDGIDPEQYMKQGNPYEILRVTYKDMTGDDD